MTIYISQHLANNLIRNIRRSLDQNLSQEANLSRKELEMDLMRDNK